MSSFNPGPFSTAAGLNLFAAVSTVAMTARDHAQALADDDATAETMGSWQSVVERQQNDIAALLALVQKLQATLATRDRMVEHLRSEIAAAEQVVAEYLDSQFR